MYELTCKVALVTGAAGKHGFGRAIANRLAKEGADIVVVDKFSVPPRDEDLAGGWRGLDTVVEEIQDLGRQALAITCDITKSDEVDEMVKKALAKFGQIDILVNNAGVHIFGDTDEAWYKNISVNLTGTFFCSRAVAREMIKGNKGGKIINIASIQGKQGSSQGDVGYSASKFGVVGTTQSLALELAPYGINVNAVCPGLAATDIGSNHFKSQAQSEGISVQEVRDRLFQERIAATPLGRLTTVEDIANIVAFLASKEADFITGQSINVNGGALTAL